MKERLSFYFYLSWKTQIDEMNDEELRRFIENLIIWHQGGDVSLPTREDKFIWNGVLPGLESNEKKYITRSGTSRENGKLGGRPTKDSTSSITQQVIEEPKKPVKSKMLNDKSELIIDNSKMLNDKSELITDNSEMSNDNSELIIDNGKISTGNQINNSGESISTLLKREIDNCNSLLDSDFSNYPFLKYLANPEGIKEVYYHIDDEKELERIKPLLEKLSALKYKLRGNYD